MASGNSTTVTIQYLNLGQAPTRRIPWLLDLFKEVVVLTSLGAYVETYGLPTFPESEAYSKHDLFDSKTSM